MASEAVQPAEVSEAWEASEVGTDAEEDQVPPLTNDIVTSTGHRPLVTSKLKEMFKAATLKARSSHSEAADEVDTDGNAPMRARRRSRKLSLGSRGGGFFAAVVAAATEANTRKIADDLLQRDLARIVSGSESGESPPCSNSFRRTPTVIRLSKQDTKSSSVDAAADASSVEGSLDGRKILHYYTSHVLLPHQVSMQIWRSVVLLVLLLEAISLPYAVAFGAGQPVGLLVGCDCVFGIDLCLSFVTAYRERVTHRLILDRRAIVYHYARTWFGLDVLALLPLWLIVSLAPYIELLKLLRLRHLGALRRETSITSKFSHLYEVSSQVGVCLLLLHLCCCALQLVGRAASPTPNLIYGRGPAQYVFRLYETFALFLGDAEIGRVLARTVVERLFCLGLLMIGALLIALLFGSVALQLAHSSLSRIRFNERMRVVNESMHFYRLPAALQERTRKRYEYAWKQYRDLQSDELLYSLSPALKRDLCLFLYSDMLRRVALFEHATPEVIAALAEALRPQFFLEKDVLCQEGQAGREMYFLKCGVVTISQRARGVLGHLDAGEYFGEMCLLSSKAFGPKAFAMDRRTCTVTAHTLVDVMVLELKDLEAVVADYPILLTNMLAVASRRLNELGEIARITSFRKAVGVAMVTACKSKQWLKRARLASSARVRPADATADAPSAATSATSDSAPLERTNRSQRADSLAAGTGSDPANVELLQLMRAMQAEMSSLRAEVQDLRKHQAAYLQPATEAKLTASF